MPYLQCAQTEAVAQKAAPANNNARCYISGPEIAELNLELLADLTENRKGCYAVPRCSDMQSDFDELLPKGLRDFDPAAPRQYFWSCCTNPGCCLTLHALQSGHFVDAHDQPGSSDMPNT